MLPLRYLGLRNCRKIISFCFVGAKNNSLLGSRSCYLSSSSVHRHVFCCQGLNRSFLKDSKTALFFLSGTRALAGTDSSSSSHSKEVDKHKHDEHDPGPPPTNYDDIPVPHKSWKDEYQKQQKVFNSFLLGALAFFGLSFYYVAYYTDSFHFEKWLPPKSYRERKKEIAKYKKEEAEAARAAGLSLSETGEQQGLPLVAGKLTTSDKKAEKVQKRFLGKERPAIDKSLTPLKLPEHIQYLLVGAGTASFAAFRAIRGHDAEAKVLVVGEEMYYPYMRPPLSKELWFSEDKNAGKNLRFKQWNGKERSLFFEPDDFYVDPEKLDTMEHGGVSVVRGRRVISIDPVAHTAFLNDGASIKYDKCLIATGGTPKNLPVFRNAGPEVAKKVTLYRKIPDFSKLDEIARKYKSIVLVGGGFLGSELACALGRRSRDTALKVTQIFPESGNMGKVLPEYLCNWTTEKVRKEGVIVKPNVRVGGARVKGDKVILTLNNGETMQADHVVVAVGLEPNVELGETSGLEVDPQHGGFRVDAELRARTDIWVVADEVLPDSEAPPPEAEESTDYGKGVIFYKRGKKVVGMVLWNVFNRMPIARKILKEDKEYEDLNEVAKLFNLHGSPDQA